MLGRLFVRAVLAFALLLTGLAVTLGVTAAPASAAGVDCLFSTPVYFDYYIDRTADGYTGVTDSQDIVLDPTSVVSGCNAPYEGYNTTCITVRLVIYYRPGVGYMTTYGPWVRSCWTPQLLASGWGGWLHRGDYVYLEARAEQDLGHYPSGTLLV